MLISGLSDIADNYDYFILDIFGVIHNGIEPFEGTRDALEELNRNGKQICLLSNSPRTAEGASLNITRMGLERDLYHHIVTSGEATHQALKKADHDFGHKCWFIGTGVMEEVLHGVDFHMVDHVSEADYILNSVPGIGPTDREYLLGDLRRAVDKDLPMICANPDLVVNIGREQYECAGTFAKLYEDMGGRVVYYGKPHSPVYEQCYEFFKSPDKSRICAVGDSFHTDIRGANDFGVDCVFNIEGIHETEVTCPEKGTIDNGLLETMLDKHDQRPTYVMGGFQW